MNRAQRVRCSVTVAVVVGLTIVFTLTLTAVQRQRRGQVDDLLLLARLTSLDQAVADLNKHLASDDRDRKPPAFATAAATARAFTFRQSQLQPPTPPPSRSPWLNDAAVVAAAAPPSVHPSHPAAVQDRAPVTVCGPGTAYDERSSTCLPNPSVPVPVLPAPTFVKAVPFLRADSDSGGGPGCQPAGEMDPSYNNCHRSFHSSPIRTLRKWVHYHMQFNAGTALFATARKAANATGECLPRICSQCRGECWLSYNANEEGRRLLANNYSSYFYEASIPPAFPMPFPPGTEDRDRFWFTTVFKNPVDRLRTALRLKMDEHRGGDDQGHPWSFAPFFLDPGTHGSPGQAHGFVHDNLPVRWLAGVRERRSIVTSDILLAKCRLALFDLVMTDHTFAEAVADVICPERNWGSDDCKVLHGRINGTRKPKPDPLLDPAVPRPFVGAWIERHRYEIAASLSWPCHVSRFCIGYWVCHVPGHARQLIVHPFCAQARCSAKVQCSTL